MTTKSISILGTALAVGMVFTACGGASSTSGEASDEAALSDTQAESSDTVSAAAELGDDELAIATAPTVDWKVSIRPEVGAALRALIYDIKLCADAGTVTVDKQTATADCNLIGINGQYRSGVTVTFNQCVLPSGGTINGVVTATTSKALAAGQTCEVGALVDVGHTVNIDALTHTRASGVVVSWKNVTGSETTERPIATLPTELALKLQGERSATLNGAELFDHLFQGAATIAFSPGSATVAPSSMISGQLTIQHVLAKYTATITANAVDKSASCCRPTSGSVEIVRSGARGEASHTFEFGPACGAIARDGVTIELPECL